MTARKAPPAEESPRPKVSRPRRRPYQAPAEPEAAAAGAAREPDEVLEPETPAVGPRPEPEARPAPDERGPQAERIINRYAGWAAGVGLIPLPVIDMAALAGLQLRMLHELARLYGADFSPWRARAVVAAVMGGVLPVSTASGLLGQLVRLIPVVGLAAGVLTLPALAGAATLALGRVCALHFCLGGDIFSLDAKKLRQDVAREMKAQG
ncbi:MAG: YcjF family protein [Thermodesulfobacteriota bacterium]